MSSTAITSVPQTAALPSRSPVLLVWIQTMWSVVIAAGAVVIGVSTLSFTLAHIGMDSLAFHFSLVAQHLSRLCNRS